MQAHPNVVIAILGATIMVSVSSCFGDGFYIYLKPEACDILSRFHVRLPTTRVDFSSEETAIVWWIGNGIGLAILLAACWRAAVARSIEIEHPRSKPPQVS